MLQSGLSATYWREHEQRGFDGPPIVQPRRESDGGGCVCIDREREALESVDSRPNCVAEICHVPVFRRLKHLSRLPLVCAPRMGQCCVKATV